jgi:hypothetical protein
MKRICIDPMVGLAKNGTAVCAACGKEYEDITNGHLAPQNMAIRLKQFEAELRTCWSAIRAKDDYHATLNFRLDNAHRVLSRIAMSKDEDVNADAKEALSYLKGERDEWRKGNSGASK